MIFKEINGTDEVLVIPEFMIGDAVVSVLKSGVYHIPQNSNIILIDGVFDLEQIWYSITTRLTDSNDEFINLNKTIVATGADKWSNIYMLHIGPQNPRIILTNVLPRYLLSDISGVNRNITSSFILRVQYEDEIVNECSYFRVDSPGTIVMSFLEFEIDELME
jgi:hypothetical protein